MVTNIVGVSGIGLSFLVVAFAPPDLLPVALVGMALLGLSMPITTGPTRAIYQAAVPPEIQGRVFTVQGSVSQAAEPVGMALAGALAEVSGVRLLWVVAGVGCIGIALIRALTPAILYLEDERPEALGDG